MCVFSFLFKVKDWTWSPGRANMCSQVGRNVLSEVQCLAPFLSLAYIKAMFSSRRGCSLGMCSLRLELITTLIETRLGIIPTTDGTYCMLWYTEYSDCRPQHTAMQ